MSWVGVSCVKALSDLYFVLSGHRMLLRTVNPNYLSWRGGTEKRAEGKLGCGHFAVGNGFGRPNQQTLSLSLSFLSPLFCPDRRKRKKQKTAFGKNDYRPKAQKREARCILLPFFFFERKSLFPPTQSAWVMGFSGVQDERLKSSPCGSERR